MNERYGYGPDPDTVEPFPGAPKFFIRAYDTRRSVVVGITRTEAGDLVLSGGPIFDPSTGIVTIWGYAARSTYAEDLPHEKSAFSRGWFYAWCFSNIDPSGDYGSVPVSEVVEVSREEFEAGLDKIKNK